MARKMRFYAAKVSSGEWAALKKLLFPRPVSVKYYCGKCDEAFESFVTPTLCPRCRRPPQYQAVELTHTRQSGHSHVNLTFPLYCPEEGDYCSEEGES